MAYGKFMYRKVPWHKKRELGIFFRPGMDRGERQEPLESDFKSLSLGHFIYVSEPWCLYSRRKIY